MQAPLALLFPSAQVDCWQFHRPAIKRTKLQVAKVVEEPKQPWLDLETGNALEGLAAGAVRYRIAVGPPADVEP